VPDVTLLCGGNAVRCSVSREGTGFVVRVGKGEHRFSLVPVAPGLLLLTAGDRSRLVHAAEREELSLVHVDGVTVAYGIAPADGGPEEHSRRGAGEGEAGGLVAPIPGVVTHVFIREGDLVRPGQSLVVVEAMKMEHVIRATRAGTVRAVRVREGDQVGGGAVVAEVGPPRAARGG
jgi:biotin carboxyl carrier protein